MSSKKPSQEHRPARAAQHTETEAINSKQPSKPAGAYQRLAAGFPPAPRPADILFLQKTVGNRAVQRMLTKIPLLKPTWPPVSTQSAVRQPATVQRQSEMIIQRMSEKQYQELLEAFSETKVKQALINLRKSVAEATPEEVMEEILDHINPLEEEAQKMKQNAPLFSSPPLPSSYGQLQGITPPLTMPSPSLSMPPMMTNTNNQNYPGSLLPGVSTHTPGKSTDNTDDVDDIDELDNLFSLLPSIPTHTPGKSTDNTDDIDDIGDLYKRFALLSSISTDTPSTSTSNLGITPIDHAPGISEQAYLNLYGISQIQAPALRFHKNRNWKQQLQDEGKFHGDAYTLRDSDYYPLPKQFNFDKREKISSNKHNPNPDYYQPEDAHTLQGYNTGLKATVERAIHRNLTDQGAWDISACNTIEDVIAKIRESGPVLIVDVKEIRGYEKYFSPDFEHDSFGKVGKRDFLQDQPLVELEVIPDEVYIQLAPFRNKLVTDEKAYQSFRNIVINSMVVQVINFLNITYG